MRLKTEKQQGPITIPRGTVLESRSTKNPEQVFQPIVICQEIRADVDENGETGMVDIRGFCLTPGIPLPPPEDIEFILIDWAIDEIRSHGCSDPERLKQIRKIYQELPPEIDSESKTISCTKVHLAECIKFFDQLPEFQNFAVCRGSESCISTLKNRGDCGISIETQGFTRSFVAHCKPRVWRK